MAAQPVQLSGWIGLVGLIALVGLVVWLTCWLLLIVLRRRAQRRHKQGTPAVPYQDLWKLSGARLMDQMSKPPRPDPPPPDQDHDA